MATKIEIEKCGDRLFMTLPADAVAQLGWGHGDILEAQIIEDSFRIHRTKTAHDYALELARKAMDEYRETFEALAKS